MGYSLMEDNRTFARYMMNFGSRRLSLVPRDGAHRRNQVDGEIHQVDILPSAKLLAVGTKIYASPPNELWDNRTRYSQFEHLKYDPTTWGELDEVTWEDRVPSNSF